LKKTLRRWKSRYYFLPLGDFLLIVTVFVFGYWIRHFALAGVLESLLSLPNDFRLGLSNYVISGSVMGCVVILMFRAFSVYRREFAIAKVEELAWILRVSFMAVIITFAFTFVSRQLMFSRFVLVFAFPTTSIAIYMWHSIFHRIYRQRARRSQSGIRVAVYGTGNHARELAEYMESQVSVPYQVEGFVTLELDSEETSAGPDENETCRELGSCISFHGFDDLFEWINENEIDELVIAEAGLSRRLTAELIYNCEQQDISYKVMADVSDLVTRTTRIIHMGGITMIESVPPPLSGSSILLKRLFDVIVTLPAMILLLPLGVLIAAAIVIDSGFPVFYFQTRLGKKQQEFRLFKFRSMHVGAHARKEEIQPSDQHELLSKNRSDPRITRVGRFIRRFSLDELPQLMNVLAGSMSLVGPRPHVPEEVNRYAVKHFKKLQVPPGLTGVCQVSGRNDLSYREMVKLDLYYVDNWSIWLDVSILIMTVPATLLRKGAY
jgi:exopolysaccharide biosynthesis polyprenyl glycosylphosphotransferase